MKSSRNICKNISQESQITRIILHQGIDIGSGAVESLIKQIGARIKIVGAQWNEKNVPQILRLRCAYLNNDIKLNISA
ncbi:hypothetical protein QUB47_25470 [Microcoleus sp. AT9_B5]